MNINARGVFFSQRAEISAMLKTQETSGSRDFSIVNISSIGGLRALAPFVSAYVPSKHAVIGLTKSAGSSNPPSHYENLLWGTARFDII